MTTEGNYATTSRALDVEEKVMKKVKPAKNYNLYDLDINTYRSNDPLNVRLSIKSNSSNANKAKFTI